jgi:hypothetical protein
MTVYRIAYTSGEWFVYSGRISYGDFVKEDVVFSSKSIADCYAWIKAMNEGLIIQNIRY